MQIGPRAEGRGTRKFDGGRKLGCSMEYVTVGMVYAARLHLRMGEPETRGDIVLISGVCGV